MISKKKIEDLLERANMDSSLFVVDVKVSNNNNISVIVDGDNGVSISKCVEYSRAIEGNLDRELEDFELSVSSYGIDQPIIMLRQYKKYIDRPVQIHLKDDTIKTGILVSVTDSTLIMNEEIVKKNRKSKKMLVGEESTEIEMDSIKLAKGLIVF